MLYVIPFILLLVVLIVLKKRESAKDGQGKDTAKSTTARKTTKKNATKTARSSQRPTSNTQVVADDIIIEKKTTLLTADLTKNIEKLIREKNFFSAEAKINQALNKDNSQHQLYLYLLDIHLAHKDDFAIDQLLKHIRSLNLEDIVQQAEAKQKVYAEQQQPHDTIESTQDTPKPKAATETKKNHAAFDALVDTNSAQSNLQQLQNQLNAAVPTTTEQPQTPAEKTDQNQPLEFSFVQDSPAPVTIEEPETTPQQIAEIQPLEFSFNPPAVETPTAIHSDEPVQKTEIQPLDFSFDLSPKTEVPLTTLEPTTTEVPDPLKFNLAEAIVPAIEPVAVSIPAIAEFDFKFDMPTAAAQSSLSLDLETTALATESPVIVAPLALEPAQAMDSIAHSDDPLAQTFPGLVQTDEMQLNLALAAQYIELGAYTSAQKLLNQDSEQYSAEQQAQSQSLLNRIAS